jgi:hypothetical protein
MDDWNLDDKSLGKSQYLKYCNSIIPQNNLQGMENNGGLTFSVVERTRQFTISIEQDN